MPKHSQNIYKYLRKRFEKKGITSDLFWSKTGRNEHVEQSNSLVRPSDVFKIFGKQNQSRAPENCEWRTENILFTDWNFKRWMFWTYAIFFGPCMCFSHDGQSVVVSTNGNTMHQTFWTQGIILANWALFEHDGQSITLLTDSPSFQRLVPYYWPFENKSYALTHDGQYDALLSDNPSHTAKLCLNRLTAPSCGVLYLKAPPLSFATFDTWKITLTPKGHLRTN